MPFVLGIEILALAIRQNSKIQGIAVGSRVTKITQYADDTTVFLRNQKSGNQVNKITFNFIWDNKIAKNTEEHNYWRTRE